MRITMTVLKHEKDDFLDAYRDKLTEEQIDEIQENEDDSFMCVVRSDSVTLFFKEKSNDR